MEKLPNFNKLEPESDFYSWEFEVKTYFESIGLWPHVMEAADIVLDEDDQETVEMVAARCRRILLHSIDVSLHPTIQHLQTAHDMYTRIKRIIVGTPAARVRALREKINRLNFSGSYVDYLTKYSNLVYQLEAENEVLSHKALTFGFLKGLPRMLSATIHPLMRNTEAADLDNIQVWNTAYEAVLEYCIDTGLYDIKKNNEKPKGKAFNTQQKDKKRKKKVKCWRCGKIGHFKSQCTEEVKQEAESNEKTGKENKTWGATCFWKASYQNNNTTAKRYMILDSGASAHSCGERNIMSNLQRLKESKEVITANGIVKIQWEGELSITLDNGEKFKLKNVSYWKNAPNLLSLGTLTKYGFKVNFDNENMNLKSFEGETIYQTIRGEDGIYKLYFQPSQERCFNMIENK